MCSTDYKRPQTAEDIFLYYQFLYGNKSNNKSLAKDILDSVDFQDLIDFMKEYTFNDYRFKNHMDYDNFLYGFTTYKYFIELFGE